MPSCNMNAAVGPLAIHAPTVPACRPLLPHQGTGKTVTLVETALQLLLAYPAATLLLCAPQVRGRPGVAPRRRPSLAASMQGARHLLGQGL